MAFSKYPMLLELERRHGVLVGNTYATDTKCREFTVLIGETLRQAVAEGIKSSTYFSVLMDGSTDCSVVEKELVYVLFVKADRTECLFFCIKNIADATALGIKAVLEKALTELDVEEWQSKLVGICVDGAAVNVGKVFQYPKAAKCAALWTAKAKAQ